MAKNWTSAQLAAIDTRNKTLLVSAAAGAGKTAALTERIIRSVTDKDNPKDISKMLIVTFTRTAAAELRQRIFGALTDALAADPENKYLSEQLIALSSAKICTIDSFYFDVVRQGFDKLGISPSLRIADAAEIALLEKAIMEETIDDLYEKDKERYSHIAECFVGLRNASKLSDIFLALYSDMDSIPEGIEFLHSSAIQMESAASRDFFDNPWGEVLKENLLNELTYIASIFEDCVEDCLADEELSVKYFPSFSYDLDFTKKLIKLLETSTYSAAKEHCVCYSPIGLSENGRVKKSAETERLADTRQKLVKKIRDIGKRSFCLSSDSIKTYMINTSDITLGIYELLTEFSNRFDKEKKQKNICSFSDIRRYALKLLIDENGDPTETAKNYSEFFTDIYIDEYQDVDRVQDLIFRAISKPHARFMVGDIKQSIYRFRGSEPDVFASYRKEFPSIDSETATKSDEASVFMSNNFRCDKTIIDFTNNVCSYIFSASAKSIGYTHADDLVYSKKQTDKVNADVPVEISMLVPPDDKKNDTDDKLLCEARYVAAQVKELLKNGRLANNKSIKPEDVAVLFRAKKMAPILASAFDELGIETTVADSKGYFENPDVLLMLCLLNSIDNPQRDVYLAGLLRSPFFNFSMDELIEIRSSSDMSHSLYDALIAYKEKENELATKCIAFDDVLSEFRDKAVALSVDKLIQYLYSTELFAVGGLVNNNEENNLLRLYEYARKYENGSFKGLYDFIAFINRLIKEGKQFESETASVTEGKVTLMNIHKSKGLEFPVCFLCATGNLFNKTDVRTSLIFDTSLGIAMKIADPTGLARMNTPMHEALVKRVDLKNTEEEMRILYVALTRARERLYISASSSYTEEKILTSAADAHKFSCDHTILSANSYIDWILSSLDPDKQNDFCKIKFVKRDEIENAMDDFASELKETTHIDRAEISAAKELLKQKFSFVYPYAESTRLPAKISVSRLLPEAKNEDSEREITELFSVSDDAEYLAPAILRGKSESENITPAMRGTATHLFLQFCDFTSGKKDRVEAELARLIEKGFIPPESRDLVFKEELSAFFESELFEEIKNAKNLVREQRFNILLPTSVLSTEEKFLRETEGEELAVQGVIDLLFESADGELILCDYKTDRLSKEERTDIDALTRKMTERHAKQLRYYAEAVERLLSRKCSKILIYSTHAGRAVEICIE